MHPTTSPRRVRAAAALCLTGAALVLGACGSDSNNSKTDTQSSGGSDKIAAAAGFKAPPKGAAKANVVQSNTPTEQFLPLLSGDAAAYWAQVFKASNLQYSPPKTVVVTTTPEQCASTSYDTNATPTYCNSTKTVVLPKGTFETKIVPNFKDGGEVAVVGILHGYSVLEQIGAFQAEQQGKVSAAQINQAANCFGGAWIGYVQKRNLLEQGDLEEIAALAQSNGADQTEASANAAALQTGIAQGPGPCQAILTGGGGQGTGTDTSPTPTPTPTPTNPTDTGGGLPTQ